MIEKKLAVTGIVQGVGFRPFVYKLALENNLRGYVNNSSKGVNIIIQGEENLVTIFLKELKEKAPALSFIDKIIIEDKDLGDFKDFKIIESEKEEKGITLISPDIGTCDKCMKEAMEGYKGRRLLYPFTNCTNCGPRYTIIKGLPYDRKNTTMKDFEMCPLCEEEYKNPLDRRFHAEPTCCENCGPQVKLLDKKGNILGGEPLRETRKLLKRGYIIGVKGIGGFNLVCNGKDEKAIETLRIKKGRPSKPLALMMKNLETIREYCNVNKYEKEILLSNKKPIVLLSKKNEELPYNISFESSNVGVLMPYTPLHQLLFDEELSALVFTSANFSGGSIISKNEEALEKLSKVADYFLIHDREIFKEVDDSVVRVLLKDIYPIRGGRGYFPRYLSYKGSKGILACGGDLKNSFAVTLGDYIYLSPYIGDLTYVENQERFKASVNHINNIYKNNIAILAYDNHPRYWSQEYIKEKGARKIGVYHHHAHIVSCMAENKVKEEVIGIAFDGIGYGEDKQLWGGEFLICNYKSFKRLGHLSYMKMPGGDSATKNPWIMGVSLAYKAFKGEKRKIEGALPESFKEKNIKVVQHILRNEKNQIFCSSMGRLFDGISSFLGFTKEATYEGEGAVYLENLAAKCEEGSKDKLYEYEINYLRDQYILDLDKLVKGILEDIKNEKSPKEIALTFHKTIIKSTCEICVLIRAKSGVNKVALSGGVFQNKLLFLGVYEGLRTQGFEVLYHRIVPCNDSGIALGQLFIAEELSKE